jgi:DNA-binding CsgD family transcriptional regulator
MESGVRKNLAGGATRPRHQWRPPWVASLGLPVWVVDPDRNISYVNSRAAELLDRSPHECVGQPCHEVLASADYEGLPYCAPNCPISRLAKKAREIAPVKVRIRLPDGEERSIQLVVIPVTAPDGGGPWLVHCILSDDRAYHLERYFTKVSSRSGENEAGGNWLQRFALTRREMEVLERLADDEDVRSIASALCLSQVTVRNHIQHILGKLGVHSIMEAVAYYLLSKD